MIKFKTIRRWIQYSILVFFIRLFIYTLNLFPRKFVLWNFNILSKIAYIVAIKERKKTIKNLNKAFAETKSPQEIKHIAKNVFKNIAFAFADYILTIKYSTKEDFSKIIEFEGIEHLSEAFSTGNGVICMTGHISSWEFSAIMPSVLGFPTSASSRKMPSPKIDKLIVGYREQRGMRNISRGKTYPLLIEILNKGECLLLMTDQDATTKGVFIDFFGKPAYTPIGIARLALDTKAIIVPMFTIRKPDLNYLFKIMPPVTLINTGNIESDLFENTKIHSTIYEEIINKYPEQWVWMHDRWKTTPEKIQKFLERKKSAQ